MMMVKEAYDAWDRVWKDIGVSHYEQTGTLVTSGTGQGWAKDSLHALTDAEIPLRLLHPDQLRDYAPLLTMKHVTLAYFLESGGVLFARRILKSLKKYVLTQGGEVREQTKIISIDPKNRNIHTGDGLEYSYDQLVITAGPWIKDLYPTLPITPSQQTVYYLDVPDKDKLAWGQSPMILDIDPGSGFYLVPPVDNLGLKIGDHRFTLTGHPDMPNKTPSPGGVMPEIRDHPYPIAYDKTCFYTVAQNEQFIYTQKEGIHILTGFSGHGFKFGAIVGDRVAELLTGEWTPKYLSNWLAGK